MRKAALLALPLLALSAVNSQAATLQLSYDASVVDAYDEQNAYDYLALLGQTARITVRIDLDAMPQFEDFFIEDYTSHNWMSITAQFSDRLMRSVEFSPTGFENYIAAYLVDDDIYALDGSTSFYPSNVEWNTSWFSLQAPPALAEGLTQRGELSSFTYTAEWGMAGFFHSLAPCGELGWDSRNCEAPVFADSGLWLQAENAVVTAQLLDSPAEVPLPASAWLFGSALLGLGARRFAKA